MKPSSKPAPLLASQRMRRVHHDGHTSCCPRVSKKDKKAKKREDNEEEIDESQVGIGSIAAGGRYDNVVGAFLAGSVSTDPNSKEYKEALAESVPFVFYRNGSYSLAEISGKGGQVQRTVFVMSTENDGLLQERVGLVRELREAGVKADFLTKTKPRLEAQFAAGERDEAPFAVILDAAELQKGLVTVKKQ